MASASEMQSACSDLQGYPGTLIATATYILTREGVLRVIFEATTDKQTPVNIVQHSYFNLAGHASGTALDHTLHINGCAVPQSPTWTVPADKQECHRACTPVPDDRHHLSRYVKACRKSVNNHRTTLIFALQSTCRGMSWHTIPLSSARCHNESTLPCRSSAW